MDIFGILMEQVKAHNAVLRENVPVKELDLSLNEFIEDGNELQPAPINCFKCGGSAYCSPHMDDFWQQYELAEKNATRHF